MIKACSSKLITGSVVLLLLSACGGGGDSSARPSAEPPTTAESPTTTPDTVTPASPNFTRVEYGERPVLYVLVDFSDWTITSNDDVHFSRMYYETYGVWDYYRRLFKGRVEITAPSETFGVPDDGIIRVIANQVHPNNPEDRDAMTAAVVSTASQIDEYIDADALDSDRNGVLTPDELTIAFVVAGRSTCRGTGCVQAALPQVRGFAQVNKHSEDGDNTITLDGVDVPHFNVQPERGLYTSLGVEDASAIATLIHELGHTVFGVSDHYGEYYNETTATPFLGEWCLLSDGPLERVSDGDLGPQIMGGYTRLETNLIRAQEVSTTSSVGLDGAAFSNLSENGVDSSIARIWLDPYEIRESLVLEYRDNTGGYDSFLGSSGAIVTRVQSLAENLSVAPPDYRRAHLIPGTGYDGSLTIGDSGQFTARDDTPGYTRNPTYAGKLVTLQYDGVTNNRGFFDVSVDEFGPERGHIRYDISPGDEANLHVQNKVIGFQNTSKAFAGTIYVNDTNFDQIDGYEIYLQGSSTLTFEIYESILDDGTPYNLLTTETTSASRSGWQRAFLTNPFRFRSGGSLFITVGIETPSVEQFVLPTVRFGDRNNYEVQSFASVDGLRYQRVDQTIFRKILLMSRQSVE